MAKGQADSRKQAEELQATLKEILAKLNADRQVEQAQSEMAIAEKTVEHSNVTQEAAADHLYRMTEIRANKEDDRDADD
jgi:glutamate-1-semialdehyde aminotransferase